MSAAPSSRCLFCTFTRSVKRVKAPNRQFHSSSKLFAKSPSQNENAKTSTSRDKASNSNDANDFSRRQLEAVNLASEQAQKFPSRSPKVKQDPWALQYFDDFTQIDPVVDKPVRAPWENIDQDARLKTDDELDNDLAKLSENLPQDRTQAEKVWLDMAKNWRATVGKEEAERHPRSATAPDLPKMNTTSNRKPKASSGAGQQSSEPSPALIRLMQMTGYSQEQLRKIRVKDVVSHAVVNQTRLGKIRKQYFLSIAGNGNGLIGIGEGKSEEPEEGKLQSHLRAIRNMQPIMRYENRTIFGDVKGKSGATELELFARPPGKLLLSL